MDNLFFILSKLAWGLLSPVNLILLLLTLAALFLLLNKISAAKWLLFPTAIVSFSLLVYPVSDVLMHPLESRFSLPAELPDKIDGIIVLGGGEELKLSSSWDRAELGSGGDRYIGTAMLAKHYPDVPVIFSGGSNFLRLEVDPDGHVASSLLSAVNVKKDRMIIESQSRNTHENFLLMKPVLPKLKGKYLLVTSAYHMPRAVGVARRQKINVIPYPVGYRSNKPHYRQWDFNAFEHIEVLEPAWREWIGLAAYYLTDKTSEWFPEPDK